MQKNIDFGTVADLYDTYVQWDADVAFFSKVCADAADEVLELMWGTGRLSIPLLQAGVRLCCVDYSSEMLDVLRHKLRKHGLDADVREQDVRELDLGRCFALVLLPFHSFSEIVEPSDRARTLARIRTHLAEGGRLILTLHNPAIQLARLDGERRKLCDSAIPGRGTTLRVWFTGRYRVGQSLGEALQEYEIRGADGRLLETRTLPLRFAIIDRRTLEKEVTESGFTVLHLWGDYTGGGFEAQCSPYMIWELEAEQ